MIEQATASPSETREAWLEHVCVTLTVGKTLYCKGNVYHRFPFEGSGATRQHRTLKLGAQWHRAYRNTERGSWSAAGRVD